MALYRTRTGGLISTRWSGAEVVRPRRVDSAIAVRGDGEIVSELMDRTRQLVAQEVGRAADQWIRSARSRWAVATGFSRGRLFGEIDTRGTVIRVRLGNDAEYARFTPDAFDHVYRLGTEAMERALDAIARESGAL